MQVIVNINTSVYLALQQPAIGPHLKYKLTLAVIMFSGAESVPLMFSSSSNIIEITKGRLLQRDQLHNRQGWVGLKLKRKMYIFIHFKTRNKKVKKVGKYFEQSFVSGASEDTEILCGFKGNFILRFSSLF